ncbi:hypothetical protein [Parashewanella curva]|uniref:hypothetical protein n=1 Tax=Parashewanella curva TaxID=2338552 RepID=UPI0014050B51|nr:hypothetical protein [Parashewanella curva]
MSIIPMAIVLCLLVVSILCFLNAIKIKKSENTKRKCDFYDYLDKEIKQKKKKRKSKKS